MSYNVTLVGEGDITMERKYGWTGGPESGLQHPLLKLNCEWESYSNENL